MAGRTREWTKPVEAAMYRCYLETRGDISAVRRVGGGGYAAVAELALKRKWADDLPEIDKEVERRIQLTVAEARARTIDVIDSYTLRQLVKVQGGQIPDLFDPSGLDKMVKLRELLTGGSTDRPDWSTMVKSFLDLSPEERAKQLANLDAIASGSGGGTR